MKRYPLFSALLLALAATSANADVRTDTLYLGTGAGAYLVELEAADIDASAPTRRVFGGYSLHRFLSLEGGYTSLFESNGGAEPLFDADVHMKGSSFDALLRPKFPLGRRMEVFGLLGYSWYDWDVSLEADDAGSVDQLEGSNWHYGVGGTWRLNGRWSLRAEWMHSNQADAAINLFTASASYTFR